MSEKEKVEALIAAIANLAYPVGMGLGPHPKDAAAIVRRLMAKMQEI